MSSCRLPDYPTRAPCIRLPSYHRRRRFFLSIVQWNWRRHQSQVVPRRLVTVCRLVCRPAVETRRPLTATDRHCPCSRHGCPAVRRCYVGLALSRTTPVDWPRSCRPPLNRSLALSACVRRRRHGVPSVLRPTVKLTSEIPMPTVKRFSLFQTGQYCSSPYERTISTVFKF